MILNASQRGGAKALGAHLLSDDNEHVTVHEVRGFVSEDLGSAMAEAHAVAKGTRCTQHLFHVSLSPPETATVSVEAFESAIDRIEQSNGLTGQPRVIVFHEKQGRRHAHAIWSRIDADTMTARPLPFFKMKLREISKELYLEHGWQMPRGLLDSKERDPRNFDLAEWQQAKRMGRDPTHLKTTIQECWTVSDSSAAFTNALERRGLYLARGDRRAHVAVTYEGEVLSIARMIGKRTKDVTAKLGKSDALRSVADTQTHIVSVVAPTLKELIAVADRRQAEALAPIHERRIAMKAQHAAERQRLDDGQKARAVTEARQRARRLRHGIMGLWARVTGKHGRTSRENEADAFSAFKRDRAQRNELVADQLEERRALQREIVAVRHLHAAQVTELHRDLARQTADREAGRDNLRDAFGRTGRSSRSERLPRASRGHDSRRASRGPDLGR